jgi:ABC-type Fe3+-hydroxamate transport system substrate-binding protein
MIAIAGGEDVAGDPGLAPAEVSWGELAGLRPEIVIVMVEGYLEDVQAQAMEVWERIESLRAARVYAVAAQSAFSDPGHLLHPDLMDDPGNTPFTLLRSPAPRTART